MNLQKFLGITFGASLLSASLSAGISYGANGVDVTTTTAVTSQNTPAATASLTPSTAAQGGPELQSASDRVEMSRSKLDQARQQLSASKAMLKAAEAEYRAAKADQEALSLRSEARKLADASGLQESGATPNRLYPVDMSQLKKAPVAPAMTGSNANNVMMDMGSDNRLQSTDVTGAMPITPQSGAPTP
jgi:multidrug efflux pump subunit AcrA (membrane-fusion protein)